VSDFEHDLSSYGCDTQRGNFSLIVHGWKEDINSEWVLDTISNLTHIRGGCVLFMDYSSLSTVQNYFSLVPHFSSIADTLYRKIIQINSNERLFMFGFSFGSRLCFEVGSRFPFDNKIDRIDACDPAGPGFDNLMSTANPQNAAKNVQCINTSIDKGTSIYNCHQNFRMGRCGILQPGSTTYPKRHHGLCPYYYNSAFKNDFIPRQDNECRSRREPESFPQNLKMGFLGINHPIVYGDFFIPTSDRSPWNVINARSLNDI
jgi:hypothetical protein